ncbi:MAG: small subunit ribosomal protein S6 [Verrucomicrobiales bacterium]|jgi:small subunit ribosomal protein S6
MSDESRKYEAIIVLNMQSEEGVDELVSSVGKEMEEEGAKLDSIEKIGKKTFAYNARKQASGYYVNYFFAGGADIVDKVRERLTLNKSIYLQHYQSVA